MSLVYYSNTCFTMNFIERKNKVLISPIVSIKSPVKGLLIKERKVNRVVAC